MPRRAPLRAATTEQPGPDRLRSQRWRWPAARCRKQGPRAWRTVVEAHRIWDGHWPQRSPERGLDDILHEMLHNARSGCAPRVDIVQAPGIRDDGWLLDDPDSVLAFGGRRWGAARRSADDGNYGRRATRLSGGRARRTPRGGDGDACVQGWAGIQWTSNGCDPGDCRRCSAGRSYRPLLQALTASGTMGRVIKDGYEDATARRVVRPRYGGHGVCQRRARYPPSSDSGGCDSHSLWASSI